MGAFGVRATPVALRLLILAFAVGIGLLQIQPALPDPRWFWALAPLPVLYLFLPRSGHWRRVAWLSLACLTGFVYAAWRAEMRLADRLEYTWEGRDVRLVGRVSGLPETTPHGQRFVLDVVRIVTPGAHVPGRVMLNLYSGTHVSPPDVVTTLRGGQCLALTVRVFRPHGSLNPGGFDYAAWLLERGIRAQGRAQPGTLQAGQCPESLRARLDAQRDSLRTRIHGHLPEAPYAGIVGALALGDQNAIPGGDRQIKYKLLIL